MISVNCKWWWATTTVEVPQNHPIFTNSGYLSQMTDDEISVEIPCKAQDFMDYISVYRDEDPNGTPLNSVDELHQTSTIRQYLVAIDIAKHLCDFEAVDLSIQKIRAISLQYANDPKKFFITLAQMSREIFDDYKTQLVDIVCHLPVKMVCAILKHKPVPESSDKDEFFTDKEFCGLPYSNIMDRTVDNFLRTTQWNPVESILVKYWNDSRNITFEEVCTIIDNIFHIEDLVRIVGEVYVTFKDIQHRKYLNRPMIEFIMQAFFLFARNEDVVAPRDDIGDISNHTRLYRLLASSVNGRCPTAYQNKKAYEKYYFNISSDETGLTHDEIVRQNHRYFEEGGRIDIANKFYRI